MARNHEAQEAAEKEAAAKAAAEREAKEAAAKAEAEAAAEAEALAARPKVVPVKTQEFWLTQTRFLKVVGKMDAEIIPASPRAPVKVVLPAEITRVIDGVPTVIPQPEDAHLKRVKPKAPPKPKTASRPPARGAITTGNGGEGQGS